MIKDSEGGVVAIPETGKNELARLNRTVQNEALSLLWLVDDVQPPLQK